MSELALFVKSLLEKGVSSSDAIGSVLEKHPDSSEAEILAAVEAAEKAIKLSSSLEAKKADAAKVADLEAKIGSIVEAKVKAETESILEKLPAPKAEESKVEFKSFFKDYIVTANSWREDFKSYLKALADDNQPLARQLSESFTKRSKFNQKAVLRGDATTGSYAVPDEFNDQVIYVAQLNSRIFDGAQKIVMNSDQMYLLGTGDVTFTSVTDQTTALTESAPAFTQTSLPLIDVGAITYIHQNLIDDSFTNIDAVLAGAYGRGFAAHVKEATTVWNVTTTGDKFNGIASTSGIGSVAVTDGGGTISYDDILNLIFSVGEVFRPDCHFEMNDRELKKIMLIRDSLGRPLFYNSNSQVGAIGSILGYPVYLNNQMPATMDSTTSARTGGTTAMILFGAANQVQIGIKGGLTIEASREFKFTNRQITYRAYCRWAQALVNTTAWAKLTGISAT